MKVLVLSKENHGFLDKTIENKNDGRLMQNIDILYFCPCSNLSAVMIMGVRMSHHAVKLLLLLLVQSREILSATLLALTLDELFCERQLDTLQGQLIEFQI